MSIFASRTTLTLDIPFDLPHTVTIQKLAGRHLAKAHQAYMAGLFSEVQERGGAKVQKDMQQLFGGDAEQTDEEKAEAKTQIEKVKNDPLNGYDKYTLVQAGVKAWSYDVKVSPEAIDDLDDDAVTFFATEIMRVTKPALFLSKDEREAERKND